MPFSDLVHETLCLIFANLSFEAGGLLCISCRKYYDLRLLRKVRLKSRQEPLNSGKLRNLLQIAATATNCESYFPFRSMGIVLRPEAHMPGKLDVEVSTCVDSALETFMQSIPGGIVNAFTLNVYNQHTAAPLFYVDVKVTREELFFERFFQECGRVGMRKLDVRMNAAFQHGLEYGLMEHGIRGLEELYLDNFYARGEGARMKLRGWLRQMTLRKLALKHVDMDDECWDEILQRETLTELQVSRDGYWDEILQSESRGRAEGSTGISLQKMLKAEAPCSAWGVSGPTLRLDETLDCCTWKTFVRKQRNVKCLSLSVFSKGIENFEWFLESLGGLHLNSLDLTFNLNESQCVLLQIGTVLSKMPNLICVRLKQIIGAEYRSMAASIIPSVPAAANTIPSVRAAAAEEDKLKWIGGLQKLCMENVAIDDDTKALLLAQIGQSQNLEEFTVVNMDLDSRWQMFDLRRLKVFRGDLGNILPKVGGMTNLHTLTLEHGWETDDSDIDIQHISTCVHLKRVHVSLRQTQKKGIELMCARIFTTICELPCLEDLALYGFTFADSHLEHYVMHQAESLHKIKSFDVRFHGNLSKNFKSRKILLRIVAHMTTLRKLCVLNHVVFEWLKTCATLERIEEIVLSYVHNFQHGVLLTPCWGHTVRDCDYQQLKSVRVVASATEEQFVTAIMRPFATKTPHAMVMVNSTPVS